MSEGFSPSDRTKLKRIPNRGNFDRDTIYGILDEGLICHLGFAAEGQPFVIPTSYARSGDELLIHGSAASRTLRAIANQIDVCVTVTLLDGLVLARSAYHHSMNYRSVVMFGRARVIKGAEEKMKALEAFTEHIVPGRWADVRPPNELELKATTILKLPIDEASAKIRTGGPVDEDEDYQMDTWAGVIPIRQSTGKPVDDDLLKDGTAAPEYIRRFKRKRRKQR